MIGARFDSTKTPLQDLRAWANKGKLQLPDFQRGWVWDDERIRSLIASVSVSFPIGAVMLLETGGEHVRFKPRPLTGTHPSPLEVSPETLWVMKRLPTPFLCGLSDQGGPGGEKRGLRNDLKRRATSFRVAAISTSGR